MKLRFDRKSFKYRILRRNETNERDSNKLFRNIGCHLNRCRRMITYLMEKQ